VSNSQGLGKELEELALRNACTKRDTARQRRWPLNRDLKAIEKRIARELNPEELMPTFDKWYSISRPHLDPKKTRDDYLAKFLAELGKVRVPTGEGEALKKALKHVSTLPTLALPILPKITEAPESWRRLAALHCELARQSANGTYFLTCRHAAKAHPVLNKDSALTVNRALEQLALSNVIASVIRAQEEKPPSFVTCCRSTAQSTTKKQQHAEKNNKTKNHENTNQDQ
jgi:hypothetical protein